MWREKAGKTPPTLLRRGEKQKCEAEDAGTRAGEDLPEGCRAEERTSEGD